MNPVRSFASRSGSRGLRCGMGLSHRPIFWSDDRSRIRVDSEGPTHHYGTIAAQGTLESDKAARAQRLDIPVAVTRVS